MAVIDVDSAEFRRLMADSTRATPEARRSAWRELRRTTLDVVNLVKRMMPVDTGRARASWGLWTAQDLRQPNAEASQADVVFEWHEASLESVQGTNVPYVDRLNEGHSRQAPAGFLDMAQEAGSIWLDERLAAIGLL